MLLLVKSKPGEEDLKKASEDLNGYVKFVVDLEKEIMTIGGERHVQGEKLLLENGSDQRLLWGGGVDLKTGEIDFDSMINIRPKDGNSSREVISPELRDKIKMIVKKFWDYEHF